MTRLAEFKGTRELVVNLTLRELRGRYKRSFLGWTWSLINPLSTVLIFSVVFKLFLKIDPPVGDPSGLHNFALFLLCGLVAWNYCSNGMTACMGALVGNANLIQKVYFPREILVVSTVLSLLVSLLIELGVLMVILLIAGNMVVPWIPVVLVVAAIETLFVFGIGLLLGALNVYFRDTQHLLTVALQALFYSMPIVYPVSLVPEKADLFGWELPLRTLYELNPLVAMVNCYRAVLYDLRFPPMGDLLYFFAWSIGLVLLGLLVFDHFEARLAEEV